jgi:hypothetical protein
MRFKLGYITMLTGLLMAWTAPVIAKSARLSLHVGL